MKCIFLCFVLVFSVMANNSYSQRTGVANLPQRAQELR